MTWQKVHAEPSGQAALYEAEGRYRDLLAAAFGQRFTAYRARWAETSRRGDPGAFPLSLDLAINGGCQLRCAMCPLPGRPAAAQRGLMDEKLYGRLLAEARERGLPAMTFGLGSEPLLHPHAPEWVARAAAAGVMDTRLGTNGLLLSEGVSARLIASGLTRLEVSVDAARAETYRAIRGGDLAALAANIRRFLELRRQAGQKTPLLRLSFLELPANQGELPLFLEQWQGLADMVSIQKPIWFPGSRLPRPAEAGTRPLAESCPQPWQRLGVAHDGRAWPCCSWFGEGLLPFRAGETAIGDIWVSREMAGLRRALAGPASGWPAPCGQCRM